MLAQMYQQGKYVSTIVIRRQGLVEALNEKTPAEVFQQSLKRVRFKLESAQ
jgi:hypothetical protein